MSNIYILHEDGIFCVSYESTVEYLTKTTTMNRKTAHDCLSSKLNSYFSNMNAKEAGVLTREFTSLEVNLHRGHKVALAESCKQGLHEVKEESLKFKIINCFTVNPVFQLEVEEHFNFLERRIGKENVQDEK